MTRRVNILKSITLSFLFIWTVLATERPASALTVSIAGAGIFSDPKAVGLGRDPYTPKLGLGGGVLFEPGSVMPILGFEWGLLYLQRQWADGVNGYVKANTLELPALIKLHFGGIFSIGAGVYAAYGFGSLENRVGKSFPYEAYSFKRPDAGVQASMAYEITGHGNGLFIEFRYSNGLLNVSQFGGGTSIKYSDYFGLLGLRI